MSLFGHKKTLIVAIVALVVAMAAFAGCANSSEEKAVAKPDVVIGKESSTTQSIVFANETKKTITNIAVSKSGATQDAVFLMADGEKWESGQTAQVFFNPEESGVYDISIKCGDDVYVLHEFSPQDAENVAIYLEGDIAYVTFERDGSAVNSLDFETELKKAADEKAAAEKAAAEQAAAEQAAAEQAAAEAAEAVEEDYGYGEWEESYDTYESNDTGGPSQTEDSCVEGGVVLR